MALILFWSSVLLVFYIYIGYPISIIMLSFFIHKKVCKKNIKPFISILIPAYNESKYIKDTIKNKLELDYPSKLIEVIVISDGSTDGTDEIVKSFDEDNIRLIRQEPRAGKTAALNLAVPQTKGSLIIFSDANSIYEVNALKILVENFADEDIGYVTGKMIYVNEEGFPMGDGCSSYMKYENLLRKYEAKIGSIVGVNGGIDAVRKELYEKMRNDQLPDFVLPLKVVEKGYRVVYESKAILKENTLKKASDEYKMRVRVSLRAFWGLFDMRKMLSIKSNNLIFAWQLWSHKVLRYSSFTFFLIAFLSNLFLLKEGMFYILTFILQILTIIASISAHYNNNPRNNIVEKLNFIYYFMLLNIASAHALLKFIFKHKINTWTPRKGV